MSRDRSPSTARLRPQRAGFTLVELLVVIGIIALLIAILLPALSRARQSANTVACAANLHTMGQALVLYINQSRHYPGAQAQLNTGGVFFGIWAPRLRNMIDGNQKVFWCPATELTHNWKPGDVIPGAPIATTAYDGWGYDIGESVLQVDAKQFSYGYNDWGTAAPNSQPCVGLGGDCQTSNNPDYREPNASLVRSSAECIVITDVVAKTTGAGKWLMNVDPRDPTQAPADLHSGGANVLFCDGHVVRMLQADLILYDPKNNNAALATSSTAYLQISALWNRDHQPH